MNHIIASQREVHFCRLLKAKKTDPIARRVVSLGGARPDFNHRQCIRCDGVMSPLRSRAMNRRSARVAMCTIYECESCSNKNHFVWLMLDASENDKRRCN